MTHQEKVELLLRHMDALGVSRYTAAPPAWRLLWRMGVEAPPPLFLGFFPLTLYLGLAFGLFWGILMWLASSLWRDVPVSALSGGAILAGICFGLLMAAYIRSIAKRHNLGPWLDYAGARARV